MSRRKMMKSDRRYLKRAGLGRQHKDLGALACALEEAKRAPREPGYAVEPDYACGVQTRLRVRRLRGERIARMMRRMLVVTGVYVGSLLLMVLLVGVAYEWLFG